MKQKIIIAAVAALIGGALGYFTQPKPEVEITEKIVYKERIVRRTVRVTRPDGTVEETINETEKRDGKESRSKKVAQSRKYLVEAMYAPLETSGYSAGVGYYVFKNVALKATYSRINGHDAYMLGVQVNF